MKVILLQDIYKHGVAGEVVTVADGFARNWLIPQKLAVQATPGALKQAQNLRARAAERRSALDARLNELAHQIDGVELYFGRRASPTGKLFGSVTTTEIAQELREKTGLDINRRRISQTTLREIGTHEVPVRLGTEIAPNIKVTIIREEQFVDFMAKLEAGAIPEIEEAAEAEATDAEAEAELSEMPVAEAEAPEQSEETPEAAE
ncbi:MAG: 50S ribosomal protein L9 [Anaerolineae bacterium]|nr:50S ribosomal protein L9 [Anaerolineae bacterium]